ncbi:MucBP domain-containing protein [Lactiplantibacillus herbarum]|uniref:MucBP domain-containing protein n=1 Tax=Lactiplantibacillus herbarum TaxID=1670446 RepID=UPI00064F5E56|nr:MucBP domain-containing protein [Lactiplantibacillus herbarum]
MNRVEQHYKMYKKGKKWLVAGITTTALALGTWNEVNAQADTDVNQSTDVSQTKVTAATTASTTVALKTATTTDQAVQTADKATTSQQDAAETSSTDQTTATSDKANATSTTQADTTKTETSKTESEDKQVTTDNVQKTTEVSKDKAATETTVTSKNTSTPITTTTTDTAIKTTTAAVDQSTPALKRDRASQPVSRAAMVKTDETIDQWMPNKTLQQAILATLNKGSYGKTWSSTADISKADLQLLTKLNMQPYSTYIDGKSTFSLEGLQYATNITDLDLLNNYNVSKQMWGDITDITPVASLTKLTTLQIASQRISDITPLANLKELVSLTLVSNHIADFSSLDSAQYTTSFKINSQFVDRSVVYVPVTGKYTMVNPVKPPKGMTFNLIDSASRAIVVSPTGTVIRLFYSGATNTLAGDQLAYQVTKNQIMPGPTTSPYAGYTVSQNPYTYYLASIFTDANGNEIVDMFTPYIVAADAQPVTVNYVDEQGKVLSDPEVLSGVVGDSYTATTKQFKGYQLVAQPDNATGTFGDAAQTVNFVYRMVNSTVTVHYQDANGKTLQADKVLTGQVGTVFSVEAPTLTGYKYQATQGNATGTYGDTPTEVTFIYDEAYSTVTVHYQDENGKTLQKDDVLTGQVGSNFTAKAPTLVGYKYQSTQGNATGVYGDMPTEVTFIYEAVSSTVTVHYQDANGKTIQKDDVLTGQVGSNFAVKAPTLVGYKYQSTQGNATGTYGDAPTEVTFVYDDVYSTVTVHYQDVNGKTLQKDSTLTGQIGTDYIVKTPTITGYKYQTVQGTLDGTYGDTSVEVTLVYQAVNSTVTVHYQDVNGKTLQADEVLTGQVGTTFNAKYPAIAGYKYQSTQGIATGMYGEKPSEVTFVYQANAVTPPVTTPDQTTTVTVHHVTTNGEQVAADQIFTGKLGEQYTTKPVTIDGYQVVTVPTNATGTFGANDIEISYVYEQATETSDGDEINPDPVEDSQRPTPTIPDKVTGKTPVKVTTDSGMTQAVVSEPKSTSTSAAATPTDHTVKAATAAINLPQTDDQTVSPLWGLALLGSLLGLAGWWQRKKQD